MKKVAFITGITGQDGSYLAEFLLQKNYEVHGIRRRASLFNTDRIDHLYQDPHVGNRRFVLHHGDLTDSSSLIHIIGKVRPDEIYNLAAQSHVAVSFEAPEYTADVDAMGTLRLLEAIRRVKLALERAGFDMPEPTYRVQISNKTAASAKAAVNRPPATKATSAAFEASVCV